MVQAYVLQVAIKDLEKNIHQSRILPNGIIYNPRHIFDRSPVNPLSFTSTGGDYHWSKAQGIYEEFFGTNKLFNVTTVLTTRSPQELLRDFIREYRVTEVYEGDAVLASFIVDKKQSKILLNDLIKNPGKYAKDENFEVSEVFLVGQH